jgi:hypothetical protein
MVAARLQKKRKIKLEHGNPDLQYWPELLLLQPKYSGRITSAQ